jgi:hypothetical protein
MLLRRDGALANSGLVVSSLLDMTEDTMHANLLTV